VIWTSKSRVRRRGGPGALPKVNIDIAVSTSMKLVGSGGRLRRDMNAPENDRAPVNELNLNHFFRF
jgi:hypothetical protein